MRFSMAHGSASLHLLHFYTAILNLPNPLNLLLPLHGHSLFASHFVFFVYFVVTFYWGQAPAMSYFSLCSEDTPVPFPPAIINSTPSTLLHGHSYTAIPWWRGGL